jgi:hypothetical protein
VLFCRDDVANFINANFEPVWESVRAVPIVRIDFGNGNVLTRTLHGNIATYACTADGKVLDILPGIYEPKTYLNGLNQLRLLANYCSVDPLTEKPGKLNETRLRDYHLGQVAALKKNEIPPRFVNMADFGKLWIEGRLKAALMPGGGFGGPSPALREAKPEDPKLDSTDDLANWKLLAEDTKQNETVRRRQIHEQLAKDNPVGPEKVTKWLYREILHADLDDPYLGLGKVLFAGYPFDKEDRAR